MEAAAAIQLKIFRGEGGGDKASYYEDFSVASVEPLSIMALLAMVHNNDPTFACRTSTCFKGKCGSCLVRVNGKDVFGCTTLARPGETVIIEPHSQFRLIRDTVVDFSQLVSGGGRTGDSGNED